MASLGNKQLQYTLCSISQESKRKQTMKFRQLIGHNMRKNFLEKSYTKIKSNHIISNHISGTIA